MATEFIEISLIDHPTWRYVAPDGLAPEHLKYTAPRSWPNRPYNALWNRCDDFVCSLFFAWDELPRSILTPWTPEQEMQLLLRLDGIVTAFELYLPVTPTAFRDWVLRYQSAMDSGRAIGRYLMATTDAERERGSGKWRPHQSWVSRWQYIINLRNQGNVGPSEIRRAEWRGLRYPEIIARENWCKPLPWLIREYAERIDKDPLVVATSFWNLVKPDETIEGLPPGYGTGVEVSVMGNPRPAPQLPTLQQTVMGRGAASKGRRQNTSGQNRTSSLSLRETMELMQQNSKRAKKGSDALVDLAEEEK
ncbi:hypothetical protein ACHAQH_008899 [Verticillium albo-atrum]